MCKCKLSPNYMSSAFTSFMSRLYSVTNSSSLSIGFATTVEYWIKWFLCCCSRFHRSHLYVNILSITTSGSSDPTTRH